jgi:regulator of RNase E activity RraA
VLVIDCREDARSASAGGILLSRLEVRGVAGFITDGGLRDTPEISQRKFPVYCKAPAPGISLITQHAVESNVPIACGGVAVFPGDVMVGDGEGVVVIPAGIAEEVARDTFEQEKLEEFVQLEIASGRPLPGTYPPSPETKARYEKWRREQK